MLVDRDAMRKQAESVKDEYDRLSEEYQKLQVSTLSCRLIHCLVTFTALMIFFVFL